MVNHRTAVVSQIRGQYLMEESLWQRASRGRKKLDYSIAALTSQAPDLTLILLIPVNQRAANCQKFI